MDSPPSKPKPAIPSHLPNGHSPLASTEARTEARDKKERDSLYAAIQTSNRGRQIVNFDGPNGYFPKTSTSANVNGKGAADEHKMASSEDDVDDHVPIRTPLATSRAHSPYTHQPTVDFDGLSWPSEYD